MLTTVVRAAFALTAAMAMAACAYLPGAVSATASPSPAPSPTASSQAEPPPTGAQHSRYVDSYWKAKADYVAAEEQYNETAFRENARQARLNVDAYERQAREDPVIMWVVVLIVLVGLGLSVAQVAKGFFLPTRVAQSAAIVAAAHATKRGGAAEDADEANGKGRDTTPADPVNTFKASMKGIEFSSASVGLMILTVSLAFFFLYLKFVYTITATGSATSGS